MRLFSRFLGLFFKLLYHEFAWSYDWVAFVVSVGLWRGWVLSALPYLSGPKVLELGHGPGHLQAALIQKKQFVVGLDESRQMGLLALKRIYSFSGIQRLVNGYAQFLPFPKSSFQQVVATFPSEYIYQLPTIHEIYRILTPGGALILLPLAWITGRRLHERLAAWLFRVTGQAPDWEDQLIEPFRRAGFIVQVERIEQPSSVILLIRAVKPTGTSLS